MRDISNDFQELKKFIDEYSLKSLSKDEKFIEILSSQHKKYYGYLNFIAEINRLRKNNSLKPNISDLQLDYLLESCSDIGNSLFVMTHGSYKTARFSLRSSIENFIKGFNQDWIVDITTRKSVFEIFEEVKQVEYFNHEPQRGLINLIHSDYIELCKDVHTASEKQMLKITALKYFPNFDIQRAESLSTITINLVSNFLYLLCEKYRSYFFDMHHRSRENVLSVIPKKLRPSLLGIKDN